MEIPHRDPRFFDFVRQMHQVLRWLRCLGKAAGGQRLQVRVYEQDIIPEVGEGELVCPKRVQTSFFGRRGGTGVVVVADKVGQGENGGEARVVVQGAETGGEESEGGGGVGGTEGEDGNEDEDEDCKNGECECQYGEVCIKVDENVGDDDVVIIEIVTVDGPGVDAGDEWVLFEKCDISCVGCFAGVNSVLWWWCCCCCHS